MNLQLAVLIGSSTFPIMLFLYDNKPIAKYSLVAMPT